MNNNIDKKLRKILVNLYMAHGFSSSTREILDREKEFVDEAISAIKSLFPQELKRKEVEEIILAENEDVSLFTAHDIAEAICSHFGIKK